MTIAVPTAERAGDKAHSLTSAKKLLGSFFSLTVPIALWLAPFSLGPTATHALAISSFMVIAWITEAFSYAVSRLIGYFLFWELKAF